MGFRHVFLVLLLIGCCGPIAAQTVAVGHIAGRATGTELPGAPLPGVTITVTGPDLREVVVTDADGRFDVQGLLHGPPATYSITAELSGFVTTTIDFITAHPGGVANVLVTLPIQCLQEVAYVDLGIPDTFKQADAVLLLRVESVSQPRAGPSEQSCIPVTEHVATVLERVKDVRPPSLTTLRFRAYGDRRSYESGRDYIAFLRWVPIDGRYVVLNPAYVVPVQAGRIQWRTFDNGGIPVDAHVSDVLASLRVLSGQLSLFR